MTPQELRDNNALILLSLIDACVTHGNLLQT
jgi:hypothetical protein